MGISWCLVPVVWAYISPTLIRPKKEIALFQKIRVSLMLQHSWRKGTSVLHLDSPIKLWYCHMLRVRHSQNLRCMVHLGHRYCSDSITVRAAGYLVSEGNNFVVYLAHTNRHLFGKNRLGRLRHSAGRLEVLRAGSERNYGVDGHCGLSR